MPGALRSPLWKEPVESGANTRASRAEEDRGQLLMAPFELPYPAMPDAFTLCGPINSFHLSLRELVFGHFQFEESCPIYKYLSVQSYLHSDASQADLTFPTLLEDRNETPV